MARDAREVRGAWSKFQRHWYGVPAADLHPFVSGYWAAEWDLRGQRPYRQKIVPYPNVQLTFRDGDALVRGPERGHVVRTLAGRGGVFGVTFRPGCFRPFLGASISTITGRTLPAATVFGADLPQITPQAIEEADDRAAGPLDELSGADAFPGDRVAGPLGELSGADVLPGDRVARALGELSGADAFPGDRVAGPLGELSGADAFPGDRAARTFDELSRANALAIEGFLRARLPRPDPLAEQAAAIVARIQAEPQLTRVDAVARSAGLGVRRLQRLFAEYVGLGPKWVIRRYRLHEVGERLAAGVDIDWVRLAAELGYADQAHFIRDFTAIVGESPTRYAARYPRH